MFIMNVSFMIHEMDLNFIVKMKKFSIFVEYIVTARPTFRSNFAGFPPVFVHFFLIAETA